MKHDHSKLNKLWLFLLGLIGIVYIGIGILIYQSGIIEGADIRNLFSGAGSVSDANERDPRVQAYEVEQDMSFWEKFTSGVMDIFGEDLPKEGQIKVKSVDRYTKEGIEGMQFSLKNAYTNEVVQSLITDSEGWAYSKMLPIGTAYYIEPTTSVKPYPVYPDTVYLKMTAPLMKVTLKHRGIDSDEEAIVEAVPALKVPTILQKPELPNGCEITALTSVLKFDGYEITHTVLSDNYLLKKPLYQKGGSWYGPNPDLYFAGNPRSENGWYSYVKPTLDAGNAYLKEQGTQHLAVDITGSSELDILSIISKGKPIIMWVTRDLSRARYNFGWYLDDGSGDYYTAVTNLHVVVLEGYNKTEVFVMDPLKGKVTYNREMFFKAYESMGSRALMIEEVNG